MTETGVDLLPAIPTSLLPVPAVIAAAGDEASDHFLDLFAANIRNPNTRAAYVPPAQFFGWRSIRNLGLRDIRPLHVAAYIETKLKAMRPPSVKQHLAALRGTFQLVGDQARRSHEIRLEGKRARLRLYEKGGKEKLVWLHREAEDFLDAYLAAAGITEPRAALFQPLDKKHRLTGRGMSRRDMLRAVKASCEAAACRLRYVITPFGERASRFSFRMAARWKPHRMWRTTPIRARQNCTTA